MLRASAGGGSARCGSCLAALPGQKPCGVKVCQSQVRQSKNHAHDKQASGGATPSGSWNTSSYPTNWNTHPCPDGYRLPTNTEFQNLINSSTVSRGGGWSSSDYGYIKFTSGSNSVEFPAVGYRSYSDGTLSYAGALGRYWSSVTSTSNSNDAYCLVFGSGNLNVTYNNKRLGFSVRCVR
ncbi:MAG: fibrobacter succinogenes major paralogous domain-containing protein [Rikenellaceae bacterium]|nr:fibrobacter succinogenes major paralogous domain-containing protein [Rikenellaceae bacterium]